MRSLPVLLFSALCLFVLFGTTVAVFSEPTPVPMTGFIFIPGVALYKDGSLVNVLLGKEKFSTLAECMSDAAQTLKKNQKYIVAGAIISGFCLPLHIYSTQEDN